MIIKKVNESFLKLEGEFEELQTVSQHFTRFAPNYIWNPRYKAGIWDGKIRFFNMLTGQLPIGLINMLCECINENNINVEEGLELFTVRPMIDEEVFNQVIGEFKTFIPHPHQIDGARKAIENGRGLVVHATSSGKTLTLYLILKYYLKYFEKIYGYKYSNEIRILVVVPTKSLIKQFSANFEEYGMNPDLIGRYYGDEKDLSHPITVGTWQSLRKIPDFLKTVEIAISDEVHHAKATEVKALFEKCIAARVRIGVTGSLHKDECDQLSIIGGFGPILDTVKTDELIRKDLVAPAEVIQINFYYSPEDAKSCRKDYRLEKTIIQNNMRRMVMVRQLVTRSKKDNLLLLFDELEFGERYFNYLKNEFPEKKFRYVSGEVTANEREEIRTFANNNEDVVIVASLGTYSTGIDIPRLHSIIFLWMGKSDIRLKQSIGRGLRKHETKEKVLIYDICDQLKYSKSHATERLKIYMEEGYPVRAVDVEYRR